MNFAFYLLPIRDVMLTLYEYPIQSKSHDVSPLPNGIIRKMTGASSKTLGGYYGTGIRR